MDNKKKTNDKYSFGQCSFCLRNAALKNGLCANCQIKAENLAGLPEEFKDIFDLRRPTDK